MDKLSTALRIDADLGITNGDEAKNFFYETAYPHLPPEVKAAIEDTADFSTVRYGVTDKRGFRMLLIGEKITTLLLPHLSQLLLPWKEKTGVFPEFRPLIVGAEPSSYLQTYFAEGIALDNGAKYHAVAYRYRANEVDDAFLLERAAKLIPVAIRKQADALNIELRDDLVFGDLRINSPRIARHRDGQAFLRVNASFKCNMTLKGPWHAGMSASKGWGRIFFAKNGPIEDSAALAKKEVFGC